VNSTVQSREAGNSLSSWSSSVTSTAAWQSKLSQCMW